LAACTPSLPREWREAIKGPDATATPRLHLTLTPKATFSIAGTPTPLLVPTALPTPTPVPRRTATPTYTATPTPPTASLTLQEGTPWYIGGRSVPFGGTHDTYISAWSRDASYADAQTLSVRSGDVMEALLYFELADMPQNVTIHRAEIGLYVSGRSNSTPMTITVRSVLRPWLSPEASWLLAKQGLPWQTPGAMGAADRAEEPVASLAVNASGVWLAFDATELVQQWLRSPATNRGLILTGDAANAVQYDLVSADAKDDRRRPRLTLTFATGAIALGPPRAASPTATGAPTADLGKPDSINILPLLPQGSTVVARTSGDLDSDGVPEIVAAYGGQRENGLRIAVVRRGAGNSPGAYRLDWTSPLLAIQAPVDLELRDVTDDGVPDVLISGDTAGSGRSLYVLLRRPGDFRLAGPVGGYFDGKGYFGESGYEVAEDSFGNIAILARRGNLTDTYVWDGANFTIQNR
jgi:hypothetical protein